MGKATQDLRKEHEAILYVLQILDKMMQSDSSGPETMLRYYGENVIGHGVHKKLHAMIGTWAEAFGIE